MNTVINKANELYERAAYEADVDPDDEKTPTPMEYIVNCEKYKQSWNKYKKALESIKESYTYVVMTDNAFYKYMDFMFHNF